MFSFLRFLSLALLLVWLGCVVTITFYVAPSLFANVSGQVPDSSVAGEIISPLLHRMDATGWIVAPCVVALLGVMASLLPRVPRSLKIAGVLLIAAWGVGLYSGIPLNHEIHAIRTDLKGRFGGYHLAPKEDPARRRFAKLHGLSMVLTMVNLGLGFGAFFCVSQLADAAPAVSASTEGRAARKRDEDALSTSH